MMQMLPQTMNEKTTTYRLAVAALAVTMLALFASACKSPTDFDTPQRVDSSQVGDTVLPLVSSQVLMAPFTQTIAVNGFIFFHDLPLGPDAATGSFAGTLTRRAGRATLSLSLNVQHDPTKSYYGAGGFIPHQAVGLTLKVADMPVDSLRFTTATADEATGAATISLAEYSPTGTLVGVNVLPASLSLSNAVVQLSDPQNNGATIQAIQCQIRLISTAEDSTGNLYFYRVDGHLFIPWP